MDVKVHKPRPSFVSIHIAEREVKGFAPDDYTLSTLLSFHSNHVTHLYLGGPRFASRWDRPSIDLSSFIALQRLGKEVQYMDIIDFEVEWLGQILKSGASHSNHALQVLALECKNSHREDQFVPHLLFPLSQNERDLAFSSLEREVKRLDLKIHVFIADVTHKTHKDSIPLWEKYFPQSWKSGRLAICRILKRMASEDHVEGVFWTDEAIQSRNELAKIHYAPV
ncbi:hypothetical protein DL96DRAFT_1621872 [Flagelloscypha sp. PMI_526]|nr:hypothetical protein DL96DRAFT_1621872 [Flagelloscypha sp. PMI_526]